MSNRIMADHAISERLSERVARMRPSLIREVVEFGTGREGLIALWFGEGCWPTPTPIVERARQALADGDHFYRPNAGTAAYREAVANYHQRVYGTTFAAANVLATGSGMQALALIAQALVTPGDEVVIVEPVWPNLPETMKLTGATPVLVGLDAKDGRWRLDLDRLIDAIGPKTKAVLVNTPNNPTGWTMAANELAALVAECGRRGVWLVTDDVYSRLTYGHDHAPFALELGAGADHLISVNSFSKAWCMTGWRLGWILAPASLITKLESLTEYNISCLPGFTQSGGVVALDEGEVFIVELKSRLAAARDLVAERLKAMPRVRFVPPDGAFYAFFSVEGMADSLEAARRLVRETGVGLAPGRAFGRSGEGFLRLCFAQEPETLVEALDRLEAFLA